MIDLPAVSTVKEEWRWISVRLMQVNVQSSLNGHLPPSLQMPSF